MSQFHRTDLKRPPRPERRPLLSSCSVLILSGFVLGMSYGGELAPEFQVLICIAGLTGLVAYIGLDHVADRRRANARRREQEYFQDRLVRHIEAGENNAIDHEELLELARQVTSIYELHERVPTRSASRQPATTHPV